jgi:hypothetical protein
MSYKLKKYHDNFVNVADTSYSKQAITATGSVIAYNGTEITYTPDSNAAYVVYDCNFQVSWDPDSQSSQPCHRLEESTNGGVTWTTINSTRIIEGSEAPYLSDDYKWHNFHLTFVLSAWTGQRMFRLAGKPHQSSSEYTIGRSYNANNSEGAGSCPHVSMYSVL